MMMMKTISQEPDFSQGRFLSPFWRSGLLQGISRGVTKHGRCPWSVVMFETTHLCFTVLESYTEPLIPAVRKGLQCLLDPTDNTGSPALCSGSWHSCGDNAAPAPPGPTRGQHCVGSGHSHQPEPQVTEQSYFGMWNISKFCPETHIRIFWKRICLSLCDTNGLLGLEKHFRRWAPAPDLAGVRHEPGEQTAAQQLIQYTGKGGGLSMAGSSGAPVTLPSAGCTGWSPEGPSNPNPSVVLIPQDEYIKTFSAQLMAVTDLRRDPGWDLFPGQSCSWPWWQFHQQKGHRTEHNVNVLATNRFCTNDWANLINKKQTKSFGASFSS